ncbi:MAG: hypothetical protein ACK44N_11260 [Bacteroidota bacterium]|jgi:hypothetical protein
MSNNTPQQILPTAANLIGFSLFVITSMHVSDKAASSWIDEFVSVVTLMLTFSCLFSFIAIRTNVNTRRAQMEMFSEYTFIFSLLGILLIILLLVFGFIE